MTDYKKLGLRIGLEIHQQLATQHKLFCNCSIKKSEQFPATVRRRMRAVAGETGGYDPAALYEFLRGREFDYNANSESSCLVELDDDPPKEINAEALGTVLQICKLLDCNVVDELYVMRKTVVDGSSPSGFQRTALVGTNGSIKTAFGSVPVSTVCLEEDSAPALARDVGTVGYRLDRLGTPLVEIATDAVMHTPVQAKKAAESIGLLLRSVSVVRGIGSIRQDINVSIEGGERIEIKGFQELERMTEVIENEVSRQVALMEIKRELHRRGLKESGFRETKDVTHVFRATRNSFLKKIISDNGRVLAMLLPEFSGLLKIQCGDRTFGKELNGYARAYGYGIIHSDEDVNKYDLSGEFSELRKTLGAEERDLILIIAGKNPEKAAAAVLGRARQCMIGVPKETRVADGVGSKYSRPLPGSERMYPETDVPPVDAKSMLAKAVVPETIPEKEKKLARIMPKEIAAQLVRSAELRLFEELLGTKADPVLIATTLLSTMKDLRRKGIDMDDVPADALVSLFGLVSKNKIDEKALPDALAMIAEGCPLAEIQQRFAALSDAEMRKIISNVKKENPGKNESALMGIAMQRLRGKAPGEKVLRMIREEMK